MSKIRIFSLSQKSLVFIKIKCAWNNQVIFLIVWTTFSALGKSNSWKILKLTITAAWRRYILSMNRHDYLFPIHGLGHDIVMWLIVDFIIVFAIIIILFLLLSNYFGKKSFDFVAIRNLQMIFFSVFKLRLFCGC